MNEFFNIFGLATLWCVAGAFQGTVIWSILLVAFLTYAGFRLSREYPEHTNKMLDKLLAK